MRRITPAGARTTSMPTAIPQEGSARRELFSPTRVVVDEINVESGCLRCPDTPCIKFQDTELNATLRIPTPVAPEPGVCPTGAIRADADGVPLIDPDRCLGCGLCAVRCPAAAIHLDPATAIAVVTPPPDSYESRPYDVVAFSNDRRRLSASFVPEDPPFEAPHRVGLQLQRFDLALLFAADPQAVFRLLARNAFLILGRPARLKNVGDNAAFAELAVGDGTRLLVVEIEPRGDVLDALRRVLAGVAIVRSRYDVEPDAVVPSIVVRRLPNERTDYYRVLWDAARRIGVDVRTLPIAVLLLAIRGHGDGLIDLICEQSILDETAPNLSATVGDRWGPVANPQSLGLAPEK